MSEFIDKLRDQIQSLFQKEQKKQTYLSNLLIPYEQCWNDKKSHYFETIDKYGFKKCKKCGLHTI